ncbi:MAG: hypothetical protein PHR26_00030 [Candidatus ainarchaeum sp.]|nr:hypothetical protein [Candidatus ainarchaeum sp.]
MTNIDQLKYIEIISKIIDFIKQKNSQALHDLESIVLEISINNDNKDLSEICVIIYALRKIISKKHFINSDSWKEYEFEILQNLDISINVFNELDLSKFNNVIKNIQLIIEKSDKELGRYISRILDDARIKLASTAYAYGLSANQAASLFSASKEELMNYIGITKMPDEDESFKNISQRVHLLEVMSKNDNI